MEAVPGSSTPPAMTSRRNGLTNHLECDFTGGDCRIGQYGDTLDSACFFLTAVPKPPIILVSHKNRTKDLRVNKQSNYFFFFFLTV